MPFIPCITATFRCVLYQIFKKSDLRQQVSEGTNIYSCECDIVKFLSVMGHTWEVICGVKVSSLVWWKKHLRTKCLKMSLSCRDWGEHMFLHVRTDMAACLKAAGQGTFGDFKGDFSLEVHKQVLAWQEIFKWNAYQIWAFWAEKCFWFFH